MTPPEIVQPLYVEQLARCAVRLGRIERDRNSRRDDISDCLCELADREVLAGTDIDVVVAVVVLHQEQAGVREVVDVQELAPRRPGSPDSSALRSGDPRLVELPHNGRQHVRARQVEVVPGPVKIGRHRRDEVAPVLAPICLAEPDTGNLGDGVGLVGRFEAAAQEILLANRLRTIARINARAPEVEQPLDAAAPARLDNRRVNHQVVVDELRRTRAVGQDSADRARDQKDVLGLVRPEPVVHGRLVAQIELLSGHAEDIRESGGLEAADDRRANQSTMPGDVDGRAFRDDTCRHARSLTCT